MDDTIKVEAKDFVISGIEKFSGGGSVNFEVSYKKVLTSLFFQAACKYVKDSMDRQFGPSWHCVMGEGFSFEVTRQAKTTLYMYYGGKTAVLLFKC